jgi:hypothetical protein
MCTFGQILDNEVGGKTGKRYISDKEKGPTPLCWPFQAPNTHPSHYPIFVHEAK